MCFGLVLILLRPLPTFQSSASLRYLLVTHTFFLMNFLISLNLLQAPQSLLTWGMLHGLLHHSAIFICSACHLFNSAWTFYVRNPRNSLLADEGWVGLCSHGIHGSLSYKETVNAGLKSCLSWVHFYYSKDDIAIAVLSYRNQITGNHAVISNHLWRECWPKNWRDNEICQKELIRTRLCTLCSSKSFFSPTSVPNHRLLQENNLTSRH